jgi:hypothetical protein
MAERQQRAELIERLESSASFYFSRPVATRPASMTDMGREEAREISDQFRAAALLLEEDGQEIERIQSAYETSYRLGGEWRDRAEKAEAELARIRNVTDEMVERYVRTFYGEVPLSDLEKADIRFALEAAISPSPQGDQT